MSCFEVDRRERFSYAGLLMRTSPTIATAALAGALMTAPAGWAQPAATPPAAPVDFAREIKPILQAACVRCHGRGNDKGGFRLDTRELLIKGGDSGPAIVPGDSGESYLVSLVSGVDPEMVMPQKGSRLTADQIALLRAWIDQGADWDASVTFARSAPVNLARRTPSPPESGPRSIDAYLRSYFQRHDVPPASRAVDDATFIRRATLDVVGMLPAPEEVRSFTADRSRGKHARLIDRLLAGNRRYAVHWLSFWNDLLRNDYKGTGYIDGGRRQITSWLYAALANNLPYDEFVARLVNPVPGTEGFTAGIVWRGVVNASQTPEMQAAQNISQVFMGVNLKCASCHDSFINDWQLADAYGLAGVYAERPLEMVECDRPTGKTAPLKFLYGELGTIDPAAPRGVRLDQLMHALTGPANGRLARTIVNRLWARFMGQGLVEPLDDMEQPSWHPDLLDWLAEDLVAHGYDLKHTMRVILTSRAYRRQSVDPTPAGVPYVFRGPEVRRMTAEQFDDAVGAVTGIWRERADARVNPMLVRAADLPSAERVRASLVAATPLQSALGRPNREQVVTSRAAAPTTLQSLELLNGSTLADRLRQASERIAAKHRTPRALVNMLFRRALGRIPTAAERSLALERLGPAPAPAAIEDLLWAILMLPEFQLVR